MRRKFFFFDKKNVFQFKMRIEQRKKFVCLFWHFDDVFSEKLRKFSYSWHFSEGK